MVGAGRVRGVGGGGGGRRCRVLDPAPAVVVDRVAWPFGRSFADEETEIARRLAVPDRRLQRLVTAMLRPGLGEGLEFDLARLATEPSVVGLDRPHLVEREKEVRITTQSLE